MTEYDYSPGAHERFMESQSRVGRWVDDANDHASEFVNPFVPSGDDPAEKSDFYASSSHRRSRSSASHSYAVPESYDHGHGHHSSSNSSSRRHNRSHISSSFNSRSSPTSSETSSTYTARPYNSRSYSHQPPHGVHAPMPQPTRSRTMPHGHYELDPRRQGDVVLPPIPPGQTYIIIPPPGKQVNVVSPDGSHVVHRVSSSPHHTSPTREQPLIKRLFGMGSPSGYSSRSGSHTSRMTGVETGGKPRRSHSRMESY